MDKIRTESRRCLYLSSSIVELYVFGAVFPHRKACEAFGNIKKLFRTSSILYPSEMYRLLDKIAQLTSAVCSTAEKWKNRKLCVMVYSLYNLNS